MGKPRKVGLRRIDAALDALIPYGFSKKQIRTNINKLLQVYGGDIGWTFIEDGSYRLLVETILQNDGDTEMKPLNPVEHQDSSQRILLENIPGNDDNSDVLTPDPVDYQEVQDKEIQVSTNGQSEVDPSQPVKIPSGGRSASFIEALEDLRHSQPSKIDKEKQETRNPGLMGLIHPNTRKRQPCYGWLSESEDEEDEIQQRNFRQPRKRRWDVGPSV